MDSDSHIHLTWVNNFVNLDKTSIKKHSTDIIIATYSNSPLLFWNLRRSHYENLISIIIHNFMCLLSASVLARSNFNAVAILEAVVILNPSLIRTETQVKLTCTHLSGNNLNLYHCFCAIQKWPWFRWWLAPSLLWCLDTMMEEKLCKNIILFKMITQLK